MADLIAATWSQQDAQNTATPPQGITGSMSPSQLAPTIRAIMGATKRFYDQSNPIFTSTGTGAAYVLTYLVAPQGGYTKGVIYRWFAHTDSTGPATLNINSLGVKSLLSRHGLPLTAGMVKSGDVVECYFDGTSFKMLGAEKHDPRFTGTLTANVVAATSLTGSGAALTALNGSNISSGTVADARLPTTMAGKTFTGTNKFTGSTWNSALSVEGASPSVFFKQTDATMSAYAGVNGTTFYILADTDGDGVYDSANNSLSFDLAGSTTGLKYFNNTVWHAGNDGAGSTLDADLLDGQQGTYYRDLTNSTGTLANARMSGDYSFSKLTLSNLLEITGSAPNIRMLDTTSGSYSGRMRLDANNLYFDSSTDDVTFGEVFRFELDTKVGYVNGQKIWTAGNDGAGTGLDADLLDGLQATDFYRDNADFSTTGNLTITGGSPTITLMDNTTGETNARIHANSNNLYLQSAASGTTSFTTRVQIEGDSGNVIIPGPNLYVGASGRVATDGNLYGSKFGGWIYDFIVDRDTAITDRSIVAGNGLTGGGTLGASRTITLGTPGTITASSTNSVGSTNHTHDFDMASFLYTGSSSTNTTYPVGEVVFATTTGAPARNGTQTLYLYDSLNYQFTNDSGSSAGTLGGTWRYRGGANSLGLWRRTA